MNAFTCGNAITLATTADTAINCAPTTVADKPEVNNNTGRIDTNANPT
ncbi:MAG: hypothetical protein V7697_03640 [Rhodococcus erythropolis]